MANYGPDQVALLLYGGYDLTIGIITTLTDKQEAILERTNGLGAAWEAHAYTGVRKAEFELEGFYDDATGSIHEALGSPPGSASGPRVWCLGVEGTATGADFVGYTGALQPTYERLAVRDELTKIKAGFKGTGEVRQGRIVRMLSSATASGASTGTPLDNSASNTSGGVGFLQVTDFSGWGAGGAVTVSLVHSADNITYANLLTFASATAEHRGYSQAVTGAIQRYVAANWTASGATGNIRFFAGLART